MLTNNNNDIHNNNFDIFLTFSFQEIYPFFFVFILSLVFVLLILFGLFSVTVFISFKIISGKIQIK